MTETQRQRTLIMVLINAFTTPLMLSAVNVALPGIAEALKLDAVSLSWIPMIYLMASAMFVFIFGRLADVHGRKRIFLCGTFFVIISSVFAAMAESAVAILCARFFQGVSAAMLYATQVAIVSSIYPPKERGKAIGLTVSMIYLGLSIGPLLGGYAIELYGWRSSFLLHIPLAILVLMIGIFLVKDEWKAEGESFIDLRGGLIYAAGIASLCYGVSQLPDTVALPYLLFSIVLILIFIYLQYQVKQPLLDVRLLLSNRNFSFSCLASLIMYTATFANVVLISLYLQYLKDFSPSMAGLIMMVQPLTMAIFSPGVGRLSDHFEARWIASFGMLLTCLGLVALASLNQQSEMVMIITALFMTGLGFSFFSSPNVSSIMASVAKRSYGSATAVVATMRIVGQLSSMILVAMVFSVYLGESEISAENYVVLQKAIRITFISAAMICLPGIWFSLRRGQTKAVPLS